MYLVGMMFHSYLLEILVIPHVILASAQTDTQTTAAGDLDVSYDGENALPPKTGVSADATVPISMEILHLVVPPGIGNAVKLGWGAPPHLNVTYLVYYAKDNEEFAAPQLATTDVSALIENLEFCTKYKFAVSMGSGQINPNNVRSVITYMDRITSPRNLLVEYEPGEVPCLLIKWSSSCPNIGQAVGYVISVFRHSTSNYVIVTLPASKRADFVHHFKAGYGEKFDIKVSTNFSGSRATDTVTYKVPNFLQPYKVRVTSNPDGAFMIYWSEPFLPPYIQRAYYEVYIYRGAQAEGNYEKYYVTRPILVYKGNESEYTFSVGLVSYDGRHRSALTDPIAANLNGDVREISDR